MIESATNNWLKLFGINNHRTRSGDEKHIDKFAWRYNIANETNSEAFVSFHLDGLPNRSDKFQVIYQDGLPNEVNSKALATEIANGLRAIMPVKNSGVISFSETGRSGQLLIMKGYTGPASALIEFGALSNAGNINFIRNNYGLIGFHVAASIYRHVVGSSPFINFYKFH